MGSECFSLMPLVPEATSPSARCTYRKIPLQRQRFDHWRSDWDLFVRRAVDSPISAPRRASVRPLSVRSVLSFTPME